MATFNTPGVYIQEIAKLPASIAQVPTAIPAFIGFTAINPGEAVRISSMVEYVEKFGGPAKAIKVSVSGTVNEDLNLDDIDDPVTTYILYYCMQMYFANGGGACWV